MLRERPRAPSSTVELPSAMRPSPMQQDFPREAPTVVFQGQSSGTPRRLTPLLDALSEEMGPAMFALNFEPGFEQYAWEAGEGGGGRFVHLSRFDDALSPDAYFDRYVPDLGPAALEELRRRQGGRDKEPEPREPVADPDDPSFWAALWADVAALPAVMDAGLQANSLDSYVPAGWGPQDPPRQPPRSWALNLDRGVFFDLDDLPRANDLQIEVPPAVVLPAVLPPGAPSTGASAFLENVMAARDQLPLLRVTPVLIDLWMRASSEEEPVHYRGYLYLHAGANDDDQIRDLLSELLPGQAGGGAAYRPGQVVYRKPSQGATPVIEPVYGHSLQRLARGDPDRRLEVRVLYTPTAAAPGPRSPAATWEAVVTPGTLRRRLKRRLPESEASVIPAARPDRRPAKDQEDRSRLDSAHAARVRGRCLYEALRQPPLKELFDGHKTPEQMAAGLVEEAEPRDLWYREALRLFEEAGRVYDLVREAVAKAQAGDAPGADAVITELWPQISPECGLPLVNLALEHLLGPGNTASVTQVQSLVDGLRDRQAEVDRHRYLRIYRDILDNVSESEWEPAIGPGLSRDLGDLSRKDLREIALDSGLAVDPALAPEMTAAEADQELDQPGGLSVRMEPLPAGQEALVAEAVCSLCNQTRGVNPRRLVEASLEVVGEGGEDRNPTRLRCAQLYYQLRPVSAGPTQTPESRLAVGGQRPPVISESDLILPPAGLTLPPKDPAGQYRWMQAAVIGRETLRAQATVILEHPEPRPDGTVAMRQRQVALADIEGAWYVARPRYLPEERALAFDLEDAHLQVKARNLVLPVSHVLCKQAGSGEWTVLNTRQGDRRLQIVHPPFTCGTAGMLTNLPRVQRLMAQIAEIDRGLAVADDPVRLRETLVRAVCEAEPPHDDVRLEALGTLSTRASRLVVGPGEDTAGDSNRNAGNIFDQSSRVTRGGNLPAAPLEAMEEDEDESDAERPDELEEDLDRYLEEDALAEATNQEVLAFGEALGDARLSGEAALSRHPDAVRYLSASFFMGSVACLQEAAQGGLPILRPASAWPDDLPFAARTCPAWPWTDAPTDGKRAATLCLADFWLRGRTSLPDVCNEIRKGNPQPKHARQVAQEAGDAGARGGDFPGQSAPNDGEGYFMPDLGQTQEPETEDQAWPKPAVAALAVMTGGPALERINLAAADRLLNCYRNAYQHPLGQTPPQPNYQALTTAATASLGKDYQDVDLALTGGELAGYLAQLREGLAAEVQQKLDDLDARLRSLPGSAVPATDAVQYWIFLHMHVAATRHVPRVPVTILASEGQEARQPVWADEMYQAALDEMGVELRADFVSYDPELAALRDDLRRSAWGATPITLTQLQTSIQTKLAPFRARNTAESVRRRLVLLLAYFLLSEGPQPANQLKADLTAWLNEHLPAYEEGGEALEDLAGLANVDAYPRLVVTFTPEGSTTPWLASKAQLARDEFHDSGKAIWDQAKLPSNLYEDLRESVKASMLQKDRRYLTSTLGETRKLFRMYGGQDPLAQ